MKQGRKKKKSRKMDSSAAAAGGRHVIVVFCWKREKRGRWVGGAGKDCAL